MSKHDDIFSFPHNNQLELDLDYNETVTIKLDDLMTTSIIGPTGSTGATGQLSTSLPWNTNITTGITNGTWAVGASGSGGSYSPYTYSDTITIGNIDPGTLHVSGDASFEGDITIKGVKLSERLDDIEKRLAILRPNNDLEGRWEELKELGERYRQLEQEILEKEKVWDILKK